MFVLKNTHYYSHACALCGLRYRSFAHKDSLFALLFYFSFIYVLVVSKHTAWYEFVVQWINTYSTRGKIIWSGARPVSTITPRNGLKDIDQVLHKWGRLKMREWKTWHHMKGVETRELATAISDSVVVSEKCKQPYQCEYMNFYC